MKFLLLLLIAIAVFLSVTIATQTSTTSSTTAKPEPILVFLQGNFNFSQAKTACSKIGRRLALYDDMMKAFQDGFERCQYGWMGDQHLGYIMQKTGARPSCGGGKIGLIYSGLRNQDYRNNGANCALKGKETPTTAFQQPLANNRSINWWVSNDPADVYRLKYLLGYSWKNKSITDLQDADLMLRSFRAIYVCCSSIKVSLNQAENLTSVSTSVTSQAMKSLIESYRKEFGNPDLKVFTQVSASYELMMIMGAATYNRSETIEAITDKANELGIDGILFDYEPTQNYSKEHAETYRDFLDELAENLHNHNIKLGMFLAGWGILDHYDVYADSKCDIFCSMSNTYYGKDVSNNLNNVAEMLRWISPDRLQIGIATTKYEDSNEESYSGWDGIKLNYFLHGLLDDGIKEIHLWPGKWNELRNLDKNFFKNLTNFVR